MTERDGGGIVNERVMRTLEELERFMAGRDDAMAIPRDAGAFVHALLLATGAKRGVEIGTSFGYSAVWAGAALAVNGGRLITIDRLPEKHERARAFFDEAGLADVVECRTGVAGDIVATLDGRFDYVLNDADKQNCTTYVRALLGRLERRAVVLTDNTVTHPEALAEFCSWVRGRGDFASTHVPVGNGMELSVFSGD